MLELFQAYTDYFGMMDLVEDLIRTVTPKGARQADGHF